MKSTVKKLSQCKREIEVEIEADETLREFNRILAQYSSNAKIPGFRPGKAPKDIVKRMFYPEIKDFLINSLVPKALKQELQSQNLKPVGSPVVKELYFKEGEPFRLKAQLEIWPEINLPEYKNIKIKKKKISVADEEINLSLEELRINASQYVPVEGRGVVDGDYVIAEMKGRDTKSKKFLPTEKVAILAGNPNNEEILNQNLVGLKPNEESHFVLTYSKDQKNKKLADKKIEYNLKVISLKERKIPEINDEFAKDLGEYENLKDLKEKIKESIIASKEKDSKQEMAKEIIKNISDKLSFELPETLVEEEYKAVLNRLLSANPEQNIKEEEVKKLKTEGRRMVTDNIKNHMILTKIAEKENIEVSEEEIHKELNAIAKANNLPLAKVIDTVNREGKREDLKNTILFKKTVDFLVESAIIE